MAIVSGTVGAVAGIGKLLAGGLTKKKIMQGAGNALKGAAKGGVKKALGRKKKRGGPGSPGDEEGGDIIQSPSGSIVPTSPLMGDIIIPYPEQPAKVRPDTTQVVNFKTITEQLESIVALTSTLEKVSGQSVKTKKKIKETNRKNKEKAAKRAKEDKREGGGALGYIGGKIGEVAEASGIMAFLGNILTGFVVVKLLPLIPGILQSIKFMGGNLHYFYLGFRGIGEAFKAGNKAFQKRLPKMIANLKEIGKPVTQAFGKVGQRIKNLFAKLGNAVPRIITKGLDAVGDAAKSVTQGVKNLGRVITGNTRGSQLGASAKALEKLTGTSGRGVQQATAGALRMRRMHGDEAARMYKGLIDNGMSNAKASKYVMNQIRSGKLTSAPLKGTLAGGLKGSKVFKGGVIKTGKRAVIKFLGKGPIVKKALRNIPIVGPIIVGVTSLLAGEPAAQALFKVGGTLVGGILGAFLPIPILGPIIGEIVGEYVGDLMYVLLMGGGPGAVMERMKQDITNVMSAGQMALDWVGRGFDRFMKGIPKLEMPWYVSWMFPDDMKSIPNPLWLLNPMNILDKMGLFWKAFFTDDAVEVGKVEKKEKKQKQNTSGGASQPPSQPPKRSSFRKGPSGTAQYNKALQNYNQSQQPQTVQPQTPVVPTSGQNTSSGEAMATGLRTGASQYIGGSSDYHIDTQFMKTVPMEQKVAMVDQMAAGYAKQGRVMEFSNQGVAGETWDTNMTYDQKVKLLERAFAAHSHSRYSDRNSIDYYIPKKGDSRFDKSAEGAEILVPTVGASSATYASGGNYGNYIEIKDEKGNVISRTGHGDTRFGPKSGTVQITPGSTKSPPTYTVAGITYDVATGLPISGHEKEEEPQITPAQPPASTPQSVERQASYDKPAGDDVQTPVILPPKQKPMAPTGGGGQIVPIGSGNVLNSYYKSQLLGFLYKQG